MVDLDILYVEEEIRSGWGPNSDPFAKPKTVTKLNHELIKRLTAGPTDDIDDVSAALALLHLADTELRAYGTGGGERHNDSEIRPVLRALRATAGRLGVTIDVPFRDFSGFRAYWGRNDGYGSWQARREMLDGFFGDAFDRLEELEARPRGPKLPPASLSSLRDPAAILDNLERIQRAVPTDPAQAVGSAKELIESTAKTVLLERHIGFDERNTDLPALVTLAQEALHLHPKQQSPGPDGTDAVKKILGGCISVAIGVSELRNRGYGTGHGASGKRVGLRSRHAHLAVNASMTWCQLMLDSLADPEAPWRSTDQSE